MFQLFTKKLIIRPISKELELSLHPLICKSRTGGTVRHMSNELSLAPIKMTYTVHGASLEKSDPPLVIMHGLFGSKMNWGYLSKEIHSKLQRKVFAVDARNHGDSPHTSDHNYPLLALDVKSFIEDQKISKSVLLGHSMGGRTMMSFALTYPELVDSLIVADISPIDSSSSQGFQEMHKIFEAMKSINLDELAAEKTVFQARKKVEKILTEKLKDARIANFLVTNIKENESGTYSWKINLDALYKNYDQHIAKFPLPENPKFEGPTLFIVGTMSDFVNRKLYDDIRKIFPKMKVLELNAGHWLHAEKPQEFLSGVCDFLKGS